MKNRSYWMLFAVMVLVGVFLIAFLNSQNQLPVVPDVNAQGMNSYSVGVYNGYGFGASPHNSLFSIGVATYGMLPQNILFPASQLGMSPHNVLFPQDGNGLTTLMTCTGCGQTMSTCGWDCGPTFLNCTGSVCGGSNTNLSCPTSMNCGSQTSLNCTYVICTGQYGTLPLTAQDIKFKQSREASQFYNFPEGLKPTLLTCPLSCGISMGICGITPGYPIGYSQYQLSGTYNSAGPTPGM